jgi:hypothetical protein
MYAVLQVDQNYDTVDDVLCLAAFTTQEEANAYVLRFRETSQQADLLWTKYNEEFAAKLDPADYPEHLCYLSAERILRELVYFINTNGSTLPGYDPPPRGLGDYNLFVVEIK